MIATLVASDCKSCKRRSVITLVESLMCGWMNAMVCKAVVVMISILIRILRTSTLDFNAVLEDSSDWPQRFNF